jgi:branched-chain amino acid transport system ATP-binding protein
MREMPSGPPAAPHAGLVVENLTVLRDGVPVVKNVSFHVGSREIVALLGPNGGGKSSLLDAISGMAAVRAGRILADGIELHRLPADRRARFAAHVPEGRRLFADQSVRENLDLGGLASPSSGRVLGDRRRAVLSAFPALERLLKRRSGVLSGGEQQMVALGRGMMGDARILLIDELSLGLAPKVAASFGDTLSNLAAQGYAVLLVEQYVELALSIADRVLVMSRGRLVFSGTAAELMQDREALREAYIGHTAADAGQEADRTEVATDLQLAGEELTAEGPSGLSSAALLLVTAVAAIVSGFCPWYSFTSYLDPTPITYHLSGWQAPMLTAVLPVAGTAVVGVVAAAWLARRESLPRILAGILASIALACLALVAARTWLFAAGLPDGDARQYARSWGLLVVLHAAAISVVILARLFLTQQPLPQHDSQTTGSEPAIRAV